MKNSKTITWSPFPIIAAANAFGDGVGNGRWVPKTLEQDDFLNICLLYKAVGLSALVPEMQACASANVGVLNEFLKTRGYDIRLGGLGPNGYGAVAAMEIASKWPVPGIEIPLRVERKTYSGVLMRDGFGTYHSRLVEDEKPLIVLKTSSKTDSILLLIPKFIPRDERDLGHITRQLFDDLNSLDPWEGWDGVRFPMVNLNQAKTLDWLIGIGKETAKGVVTIEQALQQNRFTMNHLGAKVESAAAVGSKGISNYAVINEPFVVVVVRKGLSLPLFAAYVTQENWKDPGKIF